MNFDVFGPFEVPRNKAKTLVDKQGLEELYFELQSDHPEMPNACGCYVFTLRAAKGFTPWYVGQTKTNSLFREAFNASNLNKYATVLNEGRIGRPMMFFLPMLTASGAKFKAQNSQLKSIDFLEQWLIGEALRKNPKLLNIQKTKFLKELRVTGLFNPGKGEATKASSTLKRAIGARKS